MATVTGLNAMGSGSAGNALQNTMYAIGQKTPAEIAKAAQTAAAKDKVKALVAVTVDQKPASLPPGEVVKLTNAKGKVEYYVGTYDGKLSKPLTSVSSAVSAVNTQIDKAERVQATALRTSQKIELDETKQALTEAGVPPKDIAAILKTERTANTTEFKEFKSLLAEPMLQYGTRDPATNAFVASATPTPTPKSLLTYNDPVIAPKVQANIKSANDSIAEFQLLKGITEPFLTSGNTTSGINQYAIYKALDNGAIVATKDTNGMTTGYTVSPEVAKAKGDQSGLMDATGMSKASSRALGLVLNNDAIIGGKANVIDDGKGNLFVNDATGADRYGTQKPLIDTGRMADTGQKDANGQPILGKVFAEVSTDNSKRNLVSVVSNYVQQPDNTFKYAGVDSTDYTHIEGFNPIKALVIAGMSAGLGYATPFLGGLTTVNAAGQTVATGAGIAAGGAVGGALNAALSGNNILKGGLLGGVTAFGANQLFELAQAAGGWDALYSKLGLDNFSLPTFETAATTPPIDTSITQSATDIGSNIVPSAPITPPNTQLIPTTDLSNSAFNVDGSLVGSNGGIYTNNLDAALAGPNIGNFANNQSLATDFINAAYPNTPSVLGIEPGTLATRDLSNSNFNTDGSPYIGNTTDTGSLLDTVKNLGTTAVDALGTKGLITLGAAGIGAIDNLLSSTPKAPVYTSPELNPALLGTPGVTDWTQYYNNLFKRQGVGAGQFLGYDIMNRLGDIPPELMGLLGTSAQALPTPTTTTA